MEQAQGADGLMLTLSLESYPMFLKEKYQAKRILSYLLTTSTKDLNDELKSKL